MKKYNININLIFLYVLSSCSHPSLVKNEYWFFQKDRYEEIVCGNKKRVNLILGVGVVFNLLKGEATNIKNIEVFYKDEFSEKIYFEPVDLKTNRLKYYFLNKFGKKKHFESMEFRQDSLDLILYPEFNKFEFTETIRIIINYKNLKQEERFFKPKIKKSELPAISSFNYLKKSDQIYTVRILTGKPNNLIHEYKKNGLHFLDSIKIKSNKFNVKTEKSVKYLAFQVIEDGIGFVTENKIEVYKECKDL